MGGILRNISIISGKKFKINQFKMNKKLTALSVATIALAFPIVSLAVALIPPPGIIGSFGGIFDAIFYLLWPIFAAYAVIMFIIAGFQFLTARGEPAEVAKARQSVVYGMVGVAVGVLAFSIPFIVKGLLGV